MSYVMFLPIVHVCLVITLTLDSHHNGIEKSNVGQHMDLNTRLLSVALRVRPLSSLQVTISLQ